MGKPPCAHTLWVCLLCQLSWFWPPAQSCPVRGSSATVTSTAFLCLGLCLGRKVSRKAETLPKPTIWAEPSSVVAHGEPVSIWCRGPQRAGQYYLYQKGDPQPRRRKFSLGSKDKAKFAIALMTQDLAGTYWCVYVSRGSWSGPSEPLDLVVTGMFDPPTLLAYRGPIVASGGSVTLQCSSWHRFDWFYLWDEGGDGHQELLHAQPQAEGWFQALFTVGPMSLTHRGTYRCYGVFSASPCVWSSSSDLLELLISGVSRKPSLSGLPGPVVAPGDTLTLRCQSDVNYDRFALFKTGEYNVTQRRSWQPQAGFSWADFPLGQVSGSHRGQYTCYGGYSLSSHWSAPSDPLVVLVTALLPEDTFPTLSAHPGPAVALGDSVTLRCQTGRLFDTFLLFKEGEVRPLLHLQSRHQDGVFWADFPMSPVTLAHEGTYRCYGSLGNSPTRLSRPSLPLELKVEGAPDNITPTGQTPGSTSGPHLPDHTVKNLIRLGLSGLILVVLGVLVFQVWYTERRSPGLN